MKAGFGIYGSGGTPRAGLTGGEKLRLLGMGLGALVLLAALLYFMGSLHGRRAPGEEEGVPGPASVPSVPPRPPVDRERLLRETRDATPSERLELEPGPLEHLLAAAENLFAEHFEAAGAGEPDPAAMEKDPARFRGDLFRTRGRVLSVEPIVLGPGGLPHFRGAIQREAGGVVFFATRLDAGLTRDDFVRLDGIFWKTFQGTAGGAATTAPLLIARRLVASVPAAEPARAIDPAILARVRDDTIEEKARIEEEPYFHLLSFVRHAAGTAAEFESAPEFRREEKAQVLADPAAHRGRPYRLLGHLADAFGRYPVSENAARVESVHVGWLMNNLAGLARVDAPDGTLLGGVGRGDLVWVHGYFLKNRAYENAKGEADEAPLFVAARVVRYVEPVSKFKQVLAWVALGLAGATAGWFGWMLRHDRMDAARRRAEVFRRYRERGPGGASPSAPAET